MSSSDRLPSDAPNNEGAPVADGQAGVRQFHSDLYRIARRELRSMARSGTIDTVALVTEAFLRVQGSESEWNDREHFLASMTHVMRHVLIDYARQRSAQRRGGDWIRMTSSALADLEGEGSPLDMIALDAAMSALGARSPRLERVVEFKVFGGMTSAEIAGALGVSTATVTRELRLAVAFLQHAMTGQR